MAYTIKSGDTLSQIAKEKGISLRALLGANPQIKNANKIRVGQKINIPKTGKGAPENDMIAGSKSKNPYRRMSKTQMSMLDHRRKGNEKMQENVTRAIQQSVKQGAESRDKDAARKKEDPRGERAAMEDKLKRAKRNAANKPKTAAGPAKNQKDPRGEKSAMDDKKRRAKEAFDKRQKKKKRSLFNRRDDFDGPMA